MLFVVRHWISVQQFVSHCQLLKLTEYFLFVCLCVPVGMCVCVNTFHRDPQRASESEKHCLCGHGGVDKVWSSRPRLEESILWYQPQWTLPGMGLVIAFLSNLQNYKTIRAAVKTCTVIHLNQLCNVLAKYLSLQQNTYLKVVILLLPLHPCTKQLRCVARRGVTWP